MAGPVPAVNQIYRLTYDLTLFGQKLMSTFNYRLTTVGTEADTDAACTALDAVLTAGITFQNKYRACLTPQVSIDNAWIQVIWPTRIRKLVFIKALIGNGTGTSNTPNLAASIERRGVNANRHSVGRVQLPAPDDAASLVAGSYPGGAYLTALTAFAAQMILPQVTVGGSVFQPVLIRNPVDATFQPVIEAFPKTTARTMRRRTVGVGK